MGLWLSASPGPFVFKLKIRGSGTWISDLASNTVSLSVYLEIYLDMSMSSFGFHANHPLAAADRLQKLCHLDLSLIPYEYYSQPPPPGSC